jgi:hypothetical protein
MTNISFENTDNWYGISMETKNYYLNFFKKKSSNDDTVTTTTVTLVTVSLLLLIGVWINTEYDTEDETKYQKENKLTL